MYIWIVFAILLAVSTAVVLLTYFKHQTKWWEFIIPFALSAIGFFISSIITENLQTGDQKYLSGYVVKAAHYEDWNELITYTESYVDANGKTQIRVKTRVDYHPEYWEAVDSNGHSERISSSLFNELVNRFNNKHFVELNRASYTNDGDKWETIYPNNDLLLEPTCIKIGYTNKLQTSNSVFTFQEIDPKEHSVYQYPPKQRLSYPPILGAAEQAEQKAFELLNAKVGKLKDIRVWVLIYQDQPQDLGFLQENYWKGGKQNDFVITVGVNTERVVKWAYIFSWSQSETLKIDTRNFLLDQEHLNLVALADWLYQNILEDYQARDFAEFNYIQVDPPWWATLLCFLLVAALNIGVTYWIIHNEHHD